jgi:hypothetical protein
VVAVVRLRLVLLEQRLEMVVTEPHLQLQELL